MMSRAALYWATESGGNAARAVLLSQPMQALPFTLEPTYLWYPSVAVHSTRSLPSNLPNKAPSRP